MNRDRRADVIRDAKHHASMYLACMFETGPEWLEEYTDEEVVLIEETVAKLAKRLRKEAL